MQIIRPFGKLPEPKREEQNANFTPYVFLPKLFKESEIARIRDLWNEEKVIEGKIGTDGKGEVDYKKRKSEILFLDPDINGWVYDRLAMACIMLNAQKYQFDILGFQTWLQLTSYKEGGFFGWHADHGKNLNSLRKLSITVQLSSPDEYEGGALQFLQSDSVVDAPKEAGTAIIFPSFVAHKVQEVISGNRRSIVGWIGGPPFR